MMPTRRRFFATAALLCLATLAARTPAATRPNIVFILVDDLRYTAPSCLWSQGESGKPFANTPNIDRIAAEGAKFTNSFVTTSLCSPSRASFLTGLYVHTHGVKGNGDNNALSHKLITWPMMLHDAGYETSFVGKWHMGNDPTPRPGFDHWMALPGQGQYNNPRMNVDGKDGPVPGYVTDILNNRAVEFIRAKHDKPFCLYLSHKAVHGPFTPAEKYQNLYNDVTYEHRANAKGDLSQDLEEKPALRREGSERANAAGADGGKKKGKKKAAEAAENPNAIKGKTAFTNGRGDQLIKNQLRCTMSIDDGVGMIFKALSETGSLDNTLIVFTSDNGYLWGEHGLGDKRAAYEESIRIPMLMRYPPLLKPGSNIESYALNIDIGPTMTELAGAKPIPNVQGTSLVPLMKNPQSPPPDWRKAIFLEYFSERGFPKIPTYQAARTEQWKLVHYPDLKEMDELYNLTRDPYEKHNLLYGPKKEPNTELESLLNQLIDETGAAKKAGNKSE